MDGLRAARWIMTNLNDVDLASYQANEVLIAAIERKFEILGEALARFRRLDPDGAASIPGLREAISFRNLLIHGYDVIDPLVVWQTVRDDLPPLAVALTRLIEDRTTR